MIMMKCGSSNMIEELINKYRGQQRDVSRLCCFTMLLEWIGTEESLQGLELIAGRFKTIRGARRVLPELLQGTDLDSYMTRNGAEQISPNFMQDGDLLVIDGSHSYIFYCGYLFGVNTSETFDYRPYTDVMNCHQEEYKSIKAYRKKK